MAALITELMSEPDNIEIIRGQIGAILALECANQYELAIRGGVPDARDFDISAYLENARPWELTDDKSPFPLVNVMLDKTAKAESGGTTVDAQKWKALFNLDCYGCGNLSGVAADDREAVLKAWKVGRIARRILSAGAYTYLGLRASSGQGVCERKILRMETGVPGAANLAGSAIAVIVCRIVLEVTYYEVSPQVSGVAMEPITMSCENETGKVLFQI